MTGERDVAVVILRSGRWVNVAERAEDVVRMASDPGGPRFLELEQAQGGEKVWVAAAEIALVTPAKLVDVSEILASMRGPDPQARPA